MSAFVLACRRVKLPGAFEIPANRTEIITIKAGLGRAGGGQIRIKRDVIFAFMLMTTSLCPCCRNFLFPLPEILSLTAACPADSTFRVCLGGCFIYLVIYSFYHHNCPVRGQLSSGMGLTEETHLHPSPPPGLSSTNVSGNHNPVPFRGEQISEKAPAPCLLLTEKLARLWIMSVGNQKLVTNLRQRTGEITSWTGFSGTRVWGRYEKVAQGNGAFNILFSVEKKRSSKMTSAMDRWKTPNSGRPSWIVQGEREGKTTCPEGSYGF